MNLTDPKFSLDLFLDGGGGGDLQVLPNILSPDSWLEAVVMVGVMSVKAQLAQGFSTHACQQDWPRHPCAEHPCWQPQNPPDVNLLLKCQHAGCEMRCDVFLLFIYLFNLIIWWQICNQLPTQCCGSPCPVHYGTQPSGCRISSLPAGFEISLTAGWCCSRAPFQRLLRIFLDLP